MKRILFCLGILLTSSLSFAENDKIEAVRKKCNIDAESWQSVAQSAFVSGKMDIGSTSIFVELSTKCMVLVRESLHYKEKGLNPKEEMQKVYSQWGDRALTILWDVSKASVAWVKWAAGIERDPIQNEKYVLCLNSDEITNAIGFLDESPEVKMQRTLVGFPGGIPKYVPMSKKLCAETTGEMLEQYQPYFNYRIRMMNLGQTPKEIY